MKSTLAQIVETHTEDQQKRATARIRYGKTSLRVLHLRLSLLLCVASVTMSGMPAYSQASPADGPWSGWVQCDHDVQAPGYQRRETQTWKLATHTPVGMNGTIMNLYSATWEATGGGKINRSDGQRTFTGQWALKVPPTNIQMAIFVRPDGKLIIRQWGERQHVEHAVTGLRQVTTSGAPPSSLDINHAVWEWIFPVIQESPTTTHVSGSNGTETQGAHAELMPQFAPQHNATCKWEFARGANASLPPPPGDTTVSNPSGTNPPGSNPFVSNPQGSNPGASGSNSQPGGAGSGSQRSAAAQLLTIVPGSVDQGAANVQIALRAQGTHWQVGTTQLDLGTGITVVAGPFFTSPADAYAVITIGPDAAIGTRSVTLTTGTEVVGLPNSFQVTAPAGAAPNLAGFTHPLKDPTLASSNPSQNPSVPALPVGIGTGKLPTKQVQAAAPTSANYLVTITHLRCVKAIEDDPLDRDGKGNEVYAASWIRRYDRAGNFLEQSSAQTLVYGDTRNLPPKAREQAGSLSPTGGIGNGDNIPANATDQRWSTPSDSDKGKFPLILWQGTLTDGSDVLILSPSIWESDDDQSVLSVWGQTQNALGNSLWNKPEVQTQINQQIFSPLVLGNVSGVSGNLASAAASTIIGAFGIPLLALPARAILGGGIDRPIGLIPNGVDATALPNVTIVLTREIIERALAGGPPVGGGRTGVSESALCATVACQNLNQQTSANSQGSNATPSSKSATPPATQWVIIGPGILEIDFQDTFRPSDWSSLTSGLGVSAIPGRYTMVLQVERVQ